MWIWSEGTCVCEEKHSYFLFGYIAYCLLSSLACALGSCLSSNVHWNWGFIYQLYFFPFWKGIQRTFININNLVNCDSAEIVTWSLWENVTDRETFVSFPLFVYYVSFILHDFAHLWHHHNGKGWEWESESGLQKALKHWVNLMMLWHCKYQNI